MRKEAPDMINIKDSSTSAWNVAAILNPPGPEAQPDPKTQTQRNEEALPLPDEPEEVLELSLDVLKSPWDKMFAEERQVQAAPLQGNDGPSDDTRRLTRMLVAARTTMEVQSVISEVHKHMQGWQMAAAQGDEKAIAVIKKLQKLLSRGGRKVRDLGKERDMYERQKRAEKAKQEHIEKKIKDELKRVERERRQRERSYLHERDNDFTRPSILSAPSMAALEAKITALANAMAALSSSIGTGDAGSVDGGVPADVSSGGGGEVAGAGEDVSAEV